MLCRRDGMRVAANKHTHPGRSVAQSPTDADHPIMALPGHVALIAPRYTSGVTRPAEVGWLRASITFATRARLARLTVASKILHSLGDWDLHSVRALSLEPAWPWDQTSAGHAARGLGCGNHRPGRRDCPEALGSAAGYRSVYKPVHIRSGHVRRSLRLEPTHARSRP
jgi:hypothetical protein